jgi:hypothetical protein
MAEDSGSNAILGVLVGVILVALFLFFVAPNIFGGGEPGGDIDVQIETPSPPSG